MVKRKKKTTTVLKKPKKKEEPVQDKKTQIASIKYTINLKKEVIAEMKAQIKEYEDDLRKLK